jgi:cobalt/nickel transport system ATP-binding protein
MTEKLIDIGGLRYSYEDGTVALAGVDFTLVRGETVILFGANGSGKTTFLLHLNALLRGQGDVRICGLSPEQATNVREIRRKVGMVFQDADEQLFMPTVLEDIAFAPINQGTPSDRALEEARGLLAQVGLQGREQRVPYHLSSGEKRRAAIAGVLAMRPEILVLDEPTTFLDPPGQKVLIDLLNSLSLAKVIATHDVGFAERVGSRAVFFEQGAIVCSGPVAEVARRYHWNGAAYRT